MRLLHGDHAARLVSQRVAEQVTTLAVLKQTPADRRVDGQMVHVQSDNTRWQWEADAVCTGDNVLAVTPNDNPSTGRWMRMPGHAMLAVTFYATTPSGTNLLTIPSNTILQLSDFAVRVSQRFTGVATALAGLSSSNVVGHTGIFNFVGSTIATQLDNWFSPTAAGTGISFLMAPVASGAADNSGLRRPWLKGGDTIRQDGGGWGTGVGEWLISCNVLQNPGL